MDDFKVRLLELDSKTVYLHDISKGEKIYKFNNTLYKNGDGYLQGVCRFFLRESRETTLDYLTDIIDELIQIKNDFKVKHNKTTTYLTDNNDLLKNDHSYVLTLFNTLKERFLLILSVYEETYDETTTTIKNKLINSLSNH
jgi:hypothetical protein